MLYRLLLSCILLIAGILPISAQQLDYYLPDTVTYNANIPRPEHLLGFQVGEWHVSHDRLAWYMKQLAQASDRMQLDTIGFTHERRPLLNLTVSSPKNLARAQEIQQERQAVAQGKQAYSAHAPAVVYMGFSIHGNEASGSNAALLTAYFLAAAEGPGMEKLLNNTIILLDPSLNPDGLQRFSTWVNSHKSAHPSPDPAGREFNEAWPRGRTNHYWFDLNRDWLPAQQPESQARLRQFHSWKPNVLTDHHEMGRNSTFFFQPGIPSRNHPLTPANTYRLTEGIAQYHARALDQLGSLYYSKESFDDFFYGKGSTYPDINGAVGILFEQASARGHLQENEFGSISFPFAIRNQFTTSLSTLQAVADLRSDLLEHQQTFYRESLQEGKGDENAYYLFSAGADAARAQALARLMERHDIQLLQPEGDVQLAGKVYPKESTYLLPADQPQHRLIMAMTEKRTSFQDSLFYDVSAWALPLAFNVAWQSISVKEARKMALQPASTDKHYSKLVKAEAPAYAYVLDWRSYEAPAALYSLLNAGLHARLSHKPFSVSGKAFPRGSVLIPLQNQPIAQDSLLKVMEQLVAEHQVRVTALSSGNTEGIMLGSPQLDALQLPEVAILVGDGVSSYDAGELWHLLDTRVHMPVTLLPAEDLNATDLSRYTTLIMPDGSYSRLQAENLKDWLRRGGSLLALQRAARWTNQQGITSLEFKEKEAAADSLEQKPYEDLSANRGAQQTGGSIFQATLDLSHPLAYGYEEAGLPLFRNNNLFLTPAKGGYANPLRYTQNPLLSGYIAKENLQQLENSAAVQVSAYGAGRIISFTDNPAFRAFWYGTNRLLFNAIFFSHLIDRRSTQ